MDEIDKCVFEVNAILGAPEPVAPEPVAPQNDEPLPPPMNILMVQKKHLDPTNELKRLFGPLPGENRR